MGMLDLDAFLDLRIKKLPSISEPDAPGYLFFDMFFGSAERFDPRMPHVTAENYVTGFLPQASLRRAAESLRNAARTLEEHANRVDQHTYAIEAVIPPYDHAEAA